MRGIRVSPEEVAPIIGKSPNEIRKRLRDGTIPIGKARKIGKNARGKPRYAYDIFVPLVLEYTGLREWPGGGANGKSNMALDT